VVADGLAQTSDVLTQSGAHYTAGAARNPVTLFIALLIPDQFTAGSQCDNKLVPSLR